MISGIGKQEKIRKKLEGHRSIDFFVKKKFRAPLFFFIPFRPGAKFENSFFLQFLEVGRHLEVSSSSFWSKKTVKICWKSGVIFNFNFFFEVFAEDFSFTEIGPEKLKFTRFEKL